MNNISIINSVNDIKDENQKNVVCEAKYKHFRDFFNDLFSENGFFSERLQGNGLVFRGESKNTYQLIPSALRSENIPNLSKYNQMRIPQNSDEQIMIEYILLNKFCYLLNLNGNRIESTWQKDSYYVDYMTRIFHTRQHVITEKWMDPNFSVIAALAQHYGVLTRLIDWTRDIMTALYFAVIGVKEPIDQDNNIVVWIMDIGAIQSFNLCNHKNEIPIRFVIPSYYDNPNLAAQKGVLTYWEIDGNFDCDFENQFPIDRRPLNELLTNFIDNRNVGRSILYRLQIPSAEYQEIYKQIKKLNYGAARIFPGYTGVKKQIDDDILMGIGV